MLVTAEVRDCLDLEKNLEINHVFNILKGSMLTKTMLSLTLPSILVP